MRPRRGHAQRSCSSVDQLPATLLAPATSTVAASSARLLGVSNVVATVSCAIRSAAATGRAEWMLIECDPGERLTLFWVAAVYRQTGHSALMNSATTLTR